MKDYCIVINEGYNHSTIHQSRHDDLGIYHYIKRKKYILKYFEDNIDKKIFLKNDSVCEILYSFYWGYDMYIIEDIVTKELGVLSKGSIISFKKNRKEFFDKLFGDSK